MTVNEQTPVVRSPYQGNRYAARTCSEMERADQYRFPKHSYLPNGAVIERIQEWSGGRRLYPKRHLLHIYALAAFTLAFIGLASLAVSLRIIGDFLLVSLCPATPTYRVHRRIEDSDNGNYRGG